MNSALAPSQESEGYAAGSLPPPQRGYMALTGTRPEADTAKSMHFSLLLLSETSHSWVVDVWGGVCVCRTGGGGRGGKFSPRNTRELDGSGTHP